MNGKDKNGKAKEEGSYTVNGWIETDKTTTIIDQVEKEKMTIAFPSFEKS